MCILDRGQFYSTNICINSIEAVKNFAEAAFRMDCSVTVSDEDYIVNGKSILALFSLNLLNNLKVSVPYEYKDEFIERANEWIIKEKEN